MDTAPHDLVRETVNEAAKTIPPLLVWSLTLNDWLAVFGIGYIVLQSMYLVWKWSRDWRHARRNRQMANAPRS